MKANKDFGSIIVSFFLILFAIGAWYYAGEFSNMGAIFPKTFSLVLIFCSAGYIVVSLFKGTPEAKKTPGEQIWRGLVLFAVLLIWCLLLKTLGFLVSSILSYIILAVLADHDHRPNPKRLLIHAGLGILIAGIFYIGFSEFLAVPLPKGILPL